MWTTLENWQLNQLQRLALLDPERVEALLNHLYELEPTLLQELAISAVDQDELSVEQCACLTGLEDDQVRQQLRSMQSKEIRQEAVVYVDEDRHLARMVKGGVAVWEIVRIYRQRRSADAVLDAFPSLGMNELIAALAYADVNSVEIDGQIERYEAVRQRKLAEYPLVERSA